MIIFMSDLLIFTNRSLCREDFLRRIRALAHAQPKAIVLREKDLPEEEYQVLAKDVLQICREHGVPCILHSFVHTAQKLNADAIHLPLPLLRQLSPEEKKAFTLLGASCHSVEEAQEAEALGCTYITAGHVFDTDCKKGLPGRGLAFLEKISKSVSVPVYAIGGICPQNAPYVRRAGASGFCIMSSAMVCEDPQRLIDAFADRPLPRTKSELDDCPSPRTKPELDRPAMKTALSIAGSDSSGGAGIQADIKTMIMHGVYAMTAITAVTAQNTTGVRSIQEISPSCLADQLDAVFEDIFPDAIKIGMVSSPELIRVIVNRLTFYRAKNIVVDPVMVATSGSSLLKTEAIQTLTHQLFPLAALVTPNIPEAEILSGQKIRTREDMLYAARKIHDAYHCAVLVKGGHLLHTASDLLYSRENVLWFEGKRINNPNTHGTGCTLSSAIAANLARGLSLTASVQNAKDYISGALFAMLDLGRGSGPLDHAFPLTLRETLSKNGKITENKSQPFHENVSREE